MLKRLTMLLCAFAMVAGLSACGQKTPPASPSPSQTPEQSAEVQTRTVTDVWNREVELPEKVEKIVCLGSMGPRFAAYLDAVDMMVGAEDMDLKGVSVRRDYSPVYFDQLSKLPTVGSGGGSGENNAYPEQIIELMPDVIIAGFSAEASDELQRQTGIPVVSVRYRAQDFIDEGFYRTMRLFADVIGAQDRCEEVLSYIDSCKEDLNNRTKDIPDSEKQTAYTGAVTFNGRHGFNFTYVNFPPFRAINANNVADVFLEEKVGEAEKTAEESGTAFVGQNGFEVDAEQIISWDPDIIFLDPGNMDLVNEEYKSNPGLFEALTAVQQGNVYTMPATNAAGPNITYLLINAYYAGTVLYPERFSDIKIEDKAAEIMEVMLGQNFFDEMEDGGLYYGKITIGE